MATTYEKVKKQLGVTRGRKRLPEDERNKRAELRKIESKRKLEAKRRASFVLQNRYKEEFDAVFEEEMKVLKAENKFAPKK
jgi:hypothetical protein